MRMLVHHFDDPIEGQGFSHLQARLQRLARPVVDVYLAIIAMKLVAFLDYLLEDLLIFLRYILNLDFLFVIYLAGNILEYLSGSNGCEDLM